MAHNKKIITSDHPKAIGPYSIGIQAGPFVFTSGQIGLDTSGNLVEGGIKSETIQVLNNIKAILEAGGSNLDQAVKITVYLSDIKDFADMNEVYATFFKNDPPARAIAEVAALPKGAAIEIDAIALVSGDCC